MKPKFRAGHVAIIGRPNVGKSTLLNHLIGQKLCITSEKPQTTRHTILGVKTTDDFQIIYVDTPGIHKKTPRLLNRHMNRAATGVIFDVDLILFVVDSLEWTEDDDLVCKKLTNVTCPVILVVNKVDKIPQKSLLFPHLTSLSEKFNFEKIIPLCARKETDIKMLEKILVALIPKASQIFPSDQLTDRSERFFAAEIIREKLMRQLGQELPYATTVEIENFKDDNGLLRISAVIYVDKEGQKRIVIGEKGERLKKIGTHARLDMEKMFDEKVFLQLWVKVKSGWADEEIAYR
ncbi:MAG: GTPase Era [Gammaproteobacteria bacterium]|jgi:GTP-binding protein Era|nr:GTPase Era [Gammaproteobacteria bacterium]